MRILIADDQALVRLGIRSILLSRPGLDVCGEAVDGPDAIERARQLRPDLVLMDRDLTIINSLEATREIKRILPQTAVLILGDSNSPEIVGQPLQAGADAYISKSACEKDLLAAIASLPGVEAEQPAFSLSREHVEPRAELKPAVGHTEPDTGHPRAAQQQKALFQLADELHRASSAEEIYNAALKAVLSALGCDRASAWVADENGVMRVVSSRGLSEKYLRAIEGLLPWSADEPNPLPIRVNNVETADSPGLQKQALREEGIAAMVFIPLVSNGKLIGKFMAYFNSPHEFSDEEVELDLTITRQLAFAIARLRSERALRESESRFRALSEQLDLLRVKAEQQRNKFHELFMHAPAAICLLEGREHRLTFVNWEALRISGRQRLEDLAGKPIREAIPELENQRFFNLLDKVYRTGIPYIGTEMPAMFQDAGSEKQNQVFVNFVFQPTRDIGGNVDGVLVHAVEVTARVKALQVLERNEERFLLAEAAAQFGTWEWDPDRNIATLSPELHRIFATSPADPDHAEQWAARVYPEDRERVQKLMNDGYQLGRMDFEYRYQHPELGLRWFHCRGRRVGNLSRMVGVLIEITDRKRMEEALRESEQRLRAIVETTPECVKLVAPDGTLIHMNAAGLTLVGAETPPDVIGRNVYDLIAPEDRERYREFNGRICSGERGSLEYDIIGLKGVRLRMETHAAPLRQRDGSFIHLAVTRDISKRDLAERATALLAAIIDSSDDAIVSKNLDGVITSWNKSAERLFGYTAQEAIGQPILKLIIPPDRSEEEAEILARIRRGQQIDHFETVRMRKDGTMVNVSVTISPVKDASGHVIGASKVARDITERKRNEQEREQLLTRERFMRVQAESAGRLKDEFLATVSHELRTPLNAILGWATMLRNTPGESLFPRGIEAIERNAKSQAQIIEDLLDVSRIISGQLRLNVKPISLSPIIQAALDSVRPAAEAKQLRLQVTIDPAADMLRADDARLQQIIWNLLSNSVKFTPRGGSVEVRAIRAESGIEISVSDTGEGIKPEFLPFVFDRFRQADASTTRKHMGLGLGLAIVRHLVEMHGGTIQAESAGEGRGATFRLRLPLPPVIQAPAAISATETRGSSEPGGPPPIAAILAGIRVLAVDDSADTRELLSVLLQQCGADVITAASAREALKTIVEWKPNVLVCDIGMPEEDGYRFLERVRNLERTSEAKIPAIALTGYARAEDKIQALQAGYQMFVPKPVDPNELAQRIATLVGRDTKLS